MVQSLYRRLWIHTKGSSWLPRSICSHGKPWLCPNHSCPSYKHDLELDEMDISTAYLNGELEEELYLLPLSRDAIQPGYCWKFWHSLYGLKQAGWTWNRTLDKKLGELGFTHLDAETCLYVLQKDGQVCFLVIDVDDLLLAARSRSHINTIKEMLSSTFKIHNLGEAKYLLGIEIWRDWKLRTISLS